MIASLDGATAIKGRSASLGGPADKAIFMALRSVADVIVVGAGTVRAEHYGAPVLPEAEQDRRQRRGQSRLPRLAIVTGSLDLDAEGPIFSQPASRPIIITSTASPAAVRARLATAADVIAEGTDDLDLAAACRALRHDHGAGVVLCEGGPTLNGALLAADLVEELCLTVAPTLVGGTSDRIAFGPEHTRALTLAHLLEEDGMLFARYLRSAVQ